MGQFWPARRGFVCRVSRRRLGGLLRGRCDPVHQVGLGVDPGAGNASGIGQRRDGDVRAVGWLRAPSGLRPIGARNCQQASSSLSPAVAAAFSRLSVILDVRLSAVREVYCTVRYLLVCGLVSSRRPPQSSAVTNELAIPHPSSRQRVPWSTPSRLRAADIDTSGHTGQVGRLQGSVEASRGVELWCGRIATRTRVSARARGDHRLHPSCTPSVGVGQTSQPTPALQASPPTASGLDTDPR
jgi:hypothetical protein